MALALASLPILKSVLEIPDTDTTEDAKLQIFLNWAYEIIETYLNRKLEKKERTEFYDGTGKQVLLLRARPVYTTPTIVVMVNESGLYGANSGSFTSSQAHTLLYGEDFGLRIDQEDGTSRSGILIRRNRFWHKRAVREAGYLYPHVGDSFGTVYVTYTGGYEAGNIPYELEAAAIAIATKLRWIYPLGLETVGQSYEERSISEMSSERRNYLQGLARPLLWNFRNWKF